MELELLPGYMEEEFEKRPDERWLVGWVERSDRILFPSLSPGVSISEIIEDWASRCWDTPPEHLTCCDNLHLAPLVLLS